MPSPLASTNTAPEMVPNARGSGVKSVGSSELPVSPSSPGLLPEALDPASLRSVPLIGLPLESNNGSPLASTAAPLPETWFSSPPVPTPSGSTSTLN